MAVKKESASGRYKVLRDCGVGQAGETVVLSEEDAALLIRDGMVTQAEEG